MPRFVMTEWNELKGLIFRWVELTLPVHRHIQVAYGTVDTEYLPQVILVDVLGEFLNDNLSQSAIIVEST